MRYNSLNDIERKEIAALFIQKLTKYIENTRGDINKRIKVDKDFIQVILCDLVSLYPNMLEYIDLDGVSFAGIDIRNKDLSDTNADIDPQTVFDKNLSGANLSKLNMSDKDFTGVCLVDTNLSGAWATIDPQTVYKKDLRGANLSGLDMSDKDFTGTNIMNANLSRTGASINPQNIYGKNLYGTNLSGLDMSDKDFTGTNIMNANLSRTGASINPQNIYGKNLRGTNLTGCTIVGKITSDVVIDYKTILENVTYEDDYEKAKQYIKSLFNQN